MVSKSYSVFLFTYLIGSTLCLIKEGEIQIGPVFGNAQRFLGHKHFEAFFDKGHGINPHLAKKVLLGVGAVGAGALAAGGAALLAKKFHQHHGGGGFGLGHSYGQGQYNTGGWYGNSAGNDYVTSQSYGSVNYPPTTEYQYQFQPSQGYPISSEGYNSYYQDQSGYNYAGATGQTGDGYYGWSQ